MARVHFEARLGVGLAGLAIQPRGASALVHLSVDTGGVVPGRVIHVNGFTAAAIDAANAAAVAGDTIFFPAGVYAHGDLTLKDGVTYRGAGIYDQGAVGGGAGTWLQCPIRWGSHQTITQMLIGKNVAGSTCFHHPTPKGSTASGSDTNANGAHSTTFSFVRFKGGSDTGGALIGTENFSNYSSGGWTGPLKRQFIVDTNFYDCEFERPQGGATSRGTLWNMWNDCRAGGGEIHGLSVRRCHFGVKNSRSTGVEQYGCGHTIIHQMAPNGTFASSNGLSTGTFGPQYITAGTGPNLGGGSQITTPTTPTTELNWNPQFDWDQVANMQHDIEFVDCLFEWVDWYPINICDHARAYSMWHGVQQWLIDYPGQLMADINVQDPADGWGNPPRSHWVDIPDDIWVRALNVTRCYFKGSTGSYNGGTSLVMEKVKESAALNNNRTLNLNALYDNTQSGSFSNSTRPNTAIFDVDWSGSTTSYTPSPYDPA